MPELRTEILVIGAGPAGIAAAVSAERAGARALLVDMQAEPGGQIWRGQWARPTLAPARQWLDALRGSPVDARYGLRLVDFAEPGLAVFDTAQGAVRVRCERLVIATGARERQLPFPGWTLPGVFGAGGLQVLVKNGWPVKGRRVVVAGSGPLLLAAAATLRAAGAEIACIAEQRRTRDLARFALSLAPNPGKCLQAAILRTKLAGVPYRRNAWVERADGAGRVESICLRRGARSERIECDALAVGFGLVPNTEIARLLGCALHDGAVVVDEHQHSSVPGVYCAGEICGIGGVDQALVQGEIAGRAAAGAATASFRLNIARSRSAHFARALRDAFVLRDELRNLAGDDTLLCRCENVTFAQVRGCRSQREARLHARLGMGHCQARICGAAGEFLFGWDAEATVRPPLAPSRLSCFTVVRSESTRQESP
ncbi:MAG: FAD-dependent oxidoreductase [Rhodanobacteraceae bacterium]|nr:FAD-dependent oxidoreductase [Rhodanobacteraceae bacterium]